MSDKQPKQDTFISDSGIIQSNKTRQAHLFVFLCNGLTLILAVLGFIAFYKGNF